MLRHLFISFFRQFKFNKNTYLLNFSVISIGFLILLFIFFFLKTEFSYEDCHKNKNRIFRLLTVAQTRNSRDISPFTPCPLGMALKNEFPQIEEVANYEVENRELFETENYTSVLRKINCDPAFLKIFSFKLLKGDVSSFVSGNGQNLFISNSLSKNMFGSQDPIGRTIKSSYGFTYIVKGVLEDPSKESHIQYDVVSPMRAPSNYWIYAQNRNTYIMLKRGAKFSAKNLNTIHYFLKDHIKNYPLIKFQPIKEIHYSTDIDDPWISNKSDKRQVYLLISAAIILVFIMLFNFFNLSTSLHLSRTKEFSIKKVLGLSSHKILSEYVFNNSILILICIGTSILLFYLFNNNWGNELNLNMHIQVKLFILISCAFLLLMLCPVFLIHFLSKIKLSGTSLSNTSNFGVNSQYRIVGMAFQIAVSVIIIVFAIVISKQMLYIKNKDLGYNYKNIVYLPANTWRYKCETIRDILVKDPNIIEASAASDLPINLTFKRKLTDWEGKDNNGFSYSYMCFTDLGFLKTFGIELKEGSNFPDHFTLEKYFDRKNEDYYIINEAAAKQMGFNDPINKKFNCDGFEGGTIVGIAKDFHFKPIQRNIEPLIIEFDPEGWMYLFIKLKKIDKASLDYIISTIEKFEDRGYPIELKFLEDDFKNLYSPVTKMAYSTIIFAITAIILSILGLIALISFLEKKKQKSFAIKKVFGAQSKRIIREFIVELSLYIVPAILFAVYIAYFGTTKWLETFAYRIKYPFMIIAGTMVLLYFLIIVIIYFKVWKSANTNPVKILKYE